MKIHNVGQGSAEWHALRAGRLTASHGQEIGNNGKGLETYVYKTLAKKYSTGQYESYTDEHMERGIELESKARSVYELLNGVTVEQIGFVEYNEYIGASPDGLVGDDGGIEIKCHDNVTHFKLLVKGEKEIDSKYRWQCQMNMLVTGRKWWDYVAYNENFQKSLVVFRIEPDEEMQKKLLAGLKKGEELIKEIMAEYENQ